jgi:hypothetical protein
MFLPRRRSPLLAFALAVTALACEAEEPPPRKLIRRAPDAGAGIGPNGDVLGGGGAGQPGGSQGGPGGLGQGGPGELGPDGDGDRAPDAFDCDPQTNRLGAKLVEDSLATATGLVNAAPGFDPGAWIHTGAAYRQDRLRSGSDASFLTVAPEGLYVVDVRAVANQVGAFYPTLRQQFVVVGGVASGGSYSGFGCGVEVVEGAATEWKASIVRLSGTPAAIMTMPIRRADRPALALGEEFGISVEVRPGTITCTVSQTGGATTVAAVDVGVVTGAIGFFTRQARTSFSKMRVCQLAG